MLTCFTSETIIESVLDPIKFYLFWTTVHYGSSILYQRLCAELSFWGFIKSSIYAQYPHCKALNWMNYLSIKTLDSYWTLMTSFFVSKATGIFKGATVKH